MEIESFLLWAKQSQLSQPFLIGEMLQFPHHFHCTFLNCSGALCLSCNGELRTGHNLLEKNHHLQPAGNTPTNAAQDTVSL